MSEIKKRWLIEGVAGTGKSSLIAQLKAQLKSASRKGKVFDEGQTFGELLEELKTHPSPEAHFWRMEQVMQALAGSLNLDYLILERFHPSYYVQFPLAEHFSRFDRQLAAWGLNSFFWIYPIRPLQNAASIVLNEKQKGGALAILPGMALNRRQ